jgi:hypothetical protein
VSVSDDGCEGLVDFVRDGGSEFAHCRRLHGPRKARLRVAQGFFHILPIVNIDEQAVPASPVPVRIIRWLPEDVKPPVRAVKPPKPVLDIVRLACHDGTRPRVDRRLHIVRVQKVEPACLR